MLTACREKPHPIAKPHGLELTSLPTAVNAPVFAPADGHYAELLLRDGLWQGYESGKFAGTFSNEDEISGFYDKFKAREEKMGRHPVLLISADGQTPLSKIRMPIKNVPLRGISHCHLHVRSPTADRKSSSYHAVSIEFGCPICRVARYEPNTEPLTIIINEDASIQQDSGGSLTGLDDSDTTGDLPVLDSVLRQYSARIRGEKSAPLVRVLVKDATPYQRFIDVLCRLQDHGLEPEWMALGEWLQLN
jgi:hypothetical protein